MPDPNLLTRRLIVASGARTFWSEAAAKADAWAKEYGLARRDLIVLVPFAELLAPARWAWATRGGWLPRIETSHTLATALGPPAPAQAGSLRQDAALDRLGAAALLRSQPWGEAWARQHPQAFDVAAARVATTAATFARSAGAQPPSARGAWWERLRARLSPIDGPGATERMLARVAMEWAILAPDPSTDALFDLEPSGWIVVQASHTDALAEGVMTASQRPSLVVEARCAWLEGDTNLPVPRVQRASCSRFEDEAQAAAAQVLAHLEAAQQPVVLVSQDREVVRRTRALLERRRVRMVDETGWRLSTTRASARVMGLLRACRPWASTDEVIDALKSALHARRAQDAVERIEALSRRHGWTRRERVRTNDMASSAAQRLWKAAEHTLSTLWAGGRARPLALWLRALREAIVDSRAWGGDDGPLCDEAGDAAMVQLWTALRLDDVDGALPDQELSLDGFVDWVDGTLEAAAFVPEADAAGAQVVITPLEKAVLRPFAAAVMPGCDERHFGTSFETDPLLGDALAVELGLPGVRDRRAARRRAFELLLAVSPVTLLHRRVEGEEPLAASPWVEWLELQWQRRTHAALAHWTDPRMQRRIDAVPTPRPAPSARRLPQRLSASTVGALRDCPYRFFSRVVLGLREAEELEDDPSKRDYGNWLHAVLYRFHGERSGARSPQEDREFLARLAGEERERLGFDDSAFLPFAISFERFAEHYVLWLARRDADGWEWHGGELDLAATWTALGDVELFGRLDRIDRRSADPAWQLVDYKTGSATSLKALVRDPLEDTQLAMYAALAQAAGLAATQAALQAVYLAVDDVDGLQEIEHPDVADSARKLVEGLAGELQRLRQGATLPALGEGRVCELCEARGLCRRDDWPALPPDASGDGAAGHE